MPNRIATRRVAFFLALFGSGLFTQEVRVQTPAPLTFVDVAAQRGVQVPDRITRGAVWEDFDGDGDLDLVMGSLFTSNQLFLNDGTGHFSEVSDQVGLSQVPVQFSFGTNVADYDNDGDPDVVFANGGFNRSDINRLYRNDRDTIGGFTEIGAAAGVAGVPAANHTAAWLDYNRDGLLDLFVHKRGSASALYRNQGDGTFVDVAPQAGVAVLFGANGVCPGDFDNDGNVDLFLPSYPLPGTNDHGMLFHNDGDGTFSDATQAAGLFAPKKSFTCAVDDFNQDGWLDLYVATFNAATDTVKEPSRLYINTGQNTFVEVAAQANAAIAADIMGLQSGDLNNDGYPEIFAGLGQPASPAPDILLLNRTDPLTGSVVFEDVSVSSGIRDVPPTRTHGMSFADFDRDGDVDVFIGMGGHLQGQEEPNRLWLNTTPSGNAWLRYRLRGVVSNRDAVDARIYLDTPDRRFYDHVSGGNGFNTRNAFEKVTGIGPRTSVDRVWIRWPSGIWQVVRTPAVRTTHAWLETGLSGPASGRAGETLLVRPVGPGGSAFEVHGSRRRIPSANPAGELLLEPPQTLLGQGTLPATGVGALPVTVPPGVTPGTVLFLQARIQIQGAWYLSNLLEITVVP